jgi:predicted DNA-binding transcriptional regulator YafY
MNPSKFVAITYTNWRGVFSARKIGPLRIKFDKNQWHQEPQWLLDALDLEKSDIRTFAIKNIHSWDPVVDDKPMDVNSREAALWSENMRLKSELEQLRSTIGPAPECRRTPQCTVVNGEVVQCACADREGGP